MKIALVTGAAKRIGRDIAESLLYDGYFLLLHYNRSKKEIESWAQNYPNQYEFIQADFSNEDDLKNITNHSKFKSVELLINSASLIQLDTCETHLSNDLKRMFQINTFSPLELMKSLKSLRGNQKTHIINLIDSQHLKHHTPYFSYMMSKKSLLDISLFSALEWAPSFRVNMICPGWILELPEGTLEDGETHPNETRHEKIPLKRQGSSKDISQAVLYLNKNHYLTGQTLYVGGGDHLV